MRITTEQCDEIIAAMRRIRTDLYDVAALDRQLSLLERPDGYRTSVRPMEGSRPASDAEGEPLPPHSDSTAAAVVTLIDGRASGVRREIDIMAGAVGEMLSLARQADGARGRALEPAKEPLTPDGCRNHGEQGMGWEPVHCQRLCRWCYDFRANEGFDAPRALLEQRARGQRISESDVERAAPHRRSKRARRRQRKAS